MPPSHSDVGVPSDPPPPPPSPGGGPDCAWVVVCGMVVVVGVVVSARGGVVAVGASSLRRRRRSARPGSSAPPASGSGSGPVPPSPELTGGGGAGGVEERRGALGRRVTPSPNRSDRLVSGFSDRRRSSRRSPRLSRRARASGMSYSPDGLSGSTCTSASWAGARLGSRRSTSRVARVVNASGRRTAGTVTGLRRTLVGRLEGCYQQLHGGRTVTTHCAAGTIAARLRPSGGLHNRYVRRFIRRPARLRKPVPTGEPDHERVSR